MLAFPGYMKQNGVAEAEGVMNKAVNAMINFWTFNASGCRHIYRLSCLQLGVVPDGSLKADQDRGKEKVVQLREFNEEVKRFTQKAAYVVSSGHDSNKRLAARSYLRSLVVGREVGIRHITADRCDRAMAELFICGTNLQQQLVASGHAEFYWKSAKQCPWR